MARPKERRRRQVVDARVQWALAARIVLHFFVFLCGSLFLGMILQYLSDPLSSMQVHLQNYWVENAPMLVAMVCLVPLFIRDMLKLSNRVAGPICRLRHSIERIGNGEAMPPLAFRRRDMWQELPELFNAMIVRLGQADRDAPASCADQCDDASVEAPSEQATELLEV